MDISLVLKCEVIILSGNIKQENLGRQFFYPVDNKEIPNVFSKCFHQHFNENVDQHLNENVDPYFGKCSDIFENVETFFYKKHYIRRPAAHRRAVASHSTH
jgi:hypothetical protein